MSRHHRAQRWSTFSPKRRAQLAPQLPLPCIRCGRPVHPDPPGWTGQPTWQVGHIQDAAKGGRPTVGNTGPEHRVCNQRAGGQAGAAVVNARRQQQRQQARGFRTW